MNKQELIQLINILDKSEVHIKAGEEILVFIEFENLKEFTEILGINSFNVVNCVLRDEYVVINLIDVDILDCEEIGLIENRYQKEGDKDE